MRTNFYSVPLKPGSIVEARVYSSVVEFRHHGSRIASHERCYSALAADLRSGTLSRRAGPQARSVARIDAAGAVASTGPLA